MKLRIVLLTALILLTGASSTSFDHTFKAPDAGTIDFKGRKVAAFALGTGVTVPRRKAAENALAKELTSRGMQGIAGNTVVPIASAEPMTRDRAIVLLKQAGVAGVVVLRVLDTQQKTVPTQWADTQFLQGLAARNYYEGPAGSERGTYDRSIVTLTLETMVYSLEPYKLLWSGQSASVDPAKLDAFIPQFARAVSEELRREGLRK